MFRKMDSIVFAWSITMCLMLSVFLKQCTCVSAPGPAFLDYGDPSDKFGSVGGGGGESEENNFIDNPWGSPTPTINVRKANRFNMDPPSRLDNRVRLEEFLKPRAKCDRRIRITNGVTRVRDKGTLVRFQCSYGFHMLGAGVAVCVRGQWSDPPPSCVREGCRAMPIPLHGSLRQLYGGGVAVFSCNYGFLLDGERILTCDGQKWNGTAPTCTEIPPITIAPPITTYSPPQPEPYPGTGTPVPTEPLEVTSIPPEETTTPIPSQETTSYPTTPSLPELGEPETENPTVIIYTDSTYRPKTRKPNSEIPPITIAPSITTYPPPQPEPYPCPVPRAPLEVTPIPPEETTTPIPPQETTSYPTTPSLPELVEPVTEKPTVTTYTDPTYRPKTRKPNAEIPPITIAPPTTTYSPPQPEPYPRTGTPVPTEPFEVTQIPPEETTTPIPQEDTTTSYPTMPSLPELGEQETEKPTVIIYSDNPTYRPKTRKPTYTTDRNDDENEVVPRMEKVEIFPEKLGNNEDFDNSNRYDFGHLLIVVGITLIAIGLVTIAGGVLTYYWRKNKGIARPNQYDLDGRTLSSHDGNDEFLWLDNRDSRDSGL